MDKVEIRTADGVCPSYLFHPTGGGSWPAVLMYMDGVGIRPAMLEVGERLATYGYLVLLPDLCYRSGPYEPMNAAQMFADPAKHGWVLRDTPVHEGVATERHYRTMVALFEAKLA
jgi:carboxymethylenebutenolidase